MEFYPPACARSWLERRGRPRGGRCLSPLLLCSSCIANTGDTERNRRRSLASASHLFTRLLDDLVRREVAGTAAPRSDAGWTGGSNDLSPAICRDAGAA